MHYVMDISMLLMPLHTIRSAMWLLSDYKAWLVENYFPSGGIADSEHAVA